MQGVTMIGDKFTINNQEYVIQKNTHEQMQILADSLNQILGLNQKELDKLSLPNAINIYAQAFLSLKKERDSGQ